MTHAPRRPDRRTGHPTGRLPAAPSAPRPGLRSRAAGRQRRHPGDSGDSGDPGVLRVRDPGDLLALVPRFLGFHPEESLVMLTVGGQGRPLHARVDLPDGAPAVGAALLAEHLSGVAAANRLARVALVVYGQDHLVARTLVDALSDQLARRGVEVACALRADGRQWFWLDGDDPDGVEDAGPGTPYDLALHPLTLAGVVDGAVVHADRRRLAASLVGDDPDEVARVATFAAAVLDEVGTAAAAPWRGPAARRVLEREARWLADRVCRFVADGARLDSADVARVAALVTVSLDLRDVTWALIRREEAGRHVDLWRDVVRRVPEELRAGPAALLGFAAWLSGQGALAWCAVERCQEVDPGHSLARLLTDVLAGAVSPSVWRPPELPELLRGWAGPGGGP